MTHAICVRCGAMKFGCLLPCKTCGLTPRSARQMVYSYLFGVHYHDLPQLRQWSSEVVGAGMPLPVLSKSDEEAWIAACGHGLPLIVEGEADVLSLPAED